MKSDQGATVSPWLPMAVMPALGALAAVAGTLLLPPYPFPAPELCLRAAILGSLPSGVGSLLLLRVHTRPGAARPTIRNMLALSAVALIGGFAMSFLP